MGDAPRPPKAGAPNVFPGLRYRDEHAAMHWLARAFGFERHALFTDDDGVVVHAEMRLGPGIVMLGAAPECEEGFNVVEIVRPLVNTDYGSREYGARDLDGHCWYFGTYRPA